MGVLLLILAVGIMGYQLGKKPSAIEEMPQTPETFQYEKVIKAWKAGEFDLFMTFSARRNSSVLIMILPDKRYDITKINSDLRDIFEEAGVPVYVNEYIHYTPENVVYELPIKIENI